MPDLITPDLVALDADLGSDKTTVVRRLAGLVAGTGRATSADGLADDALAREAQAATGLPGGIAIPHCRSAAVTEASLAFSRLDPKVDFGAPDGPADLVFLIAAPAHGDADHLTLLTALARALVRPEFVASLRAAGSADEVVRLVQEVVSRTRRRADRIPGRRTGADPGACRRRPGRRRGPAQRGRRQRLPDRHRAHLHGRRQAHRGR
jgi:PTS system fructose-specific IIC component